MANIKAIQEQLTKCGFTGKEARIYLDCHFYGSSSVQQIADRLRLNRVTVHSAVEQLLERGILTETREGRRRRVVAEPPEILFQLLNRNERELRQTRSEIEQFIALLEQEPRSSRGDPNIRFYRGIEGLKKLLDETLEAKGLVRVFIDIEQFVSLLSAEYLVDYYQRRVERHIPSRLIWPDCPFARKIRPRQQQWSMDIRLNPNFKSAKVGFFSWNDKVGIKSLAEDNLTCTIIQSPEIARFYQDVVFDQLWGSLPGMQATS